MNKIALGTAQFGIDYGINNKRGKIPKKEVYDILNKAKEFEIDTIDTAYDYGESEKVIGSFLKITNYKFKIISKLPGCKNNEVKKIFESSLNNLGLSMIYGYLIHNFESYKKDNRIWKVIEKLKKDGKIEKIGFSLYYPQELKYLFEKKIDIDIIQIPYSIFDQRFSTFLIELKQRNIEVYARSVFLQGLVFKKLDELDQRFLKIKSKMSFLFDLSKELNLPISIICIGFVLLNNDVDKVIIGVDRKKNLIENILQLNYISSIIPFYGKLKELKEDDENILIPSNWK